MKKKIMILTAAFTLVLSLGACGADDVSEQTNSSSESISVQTGGSSESTSEQTSDTGSTDGETSILVAYFSVPEDIDTNGIDADAGASVVVKDDQVMGNLEYMADIIQQTVGADTFRIETVETYPLEHDALVDQAAEEQDAQARPQLASQIENPAQYDVILLGYPN